MDVPPQRWLYRLSLAPFSIGFLVPVVLLAPSYIFALFVAALLVYTVYALLHLFVVVKYLTKTELKDLKYGYSFGLLGTLLLVIPLIDATNVNLGNVSIVDIVVIIASAALLVYSEGLFGRLVSAKRAKRIGYWKDEAVEVYSKMKGYATSLSFLVVFVALLSLLLLVYVSPTQSVGIQQLLMLIPVSGNSYYVLFSLVFMNIAVYSLVMLFMGVLYAQGDLSDIAMRPGG